jgi:PKD repeat protein
VDQPVTFDGTGSNDSDGTIIAYDWDYGDGTTDFDAGPVPSHTYTADGTYPVTLTVTDDAGGVATDTTSATIGSGTLAPVADASGPYTADLGTSVTFDGTASSDPDGTIVTYNWNFGDGTTLEDGGATPTHTYATAGTYNVTLTVVDNDGLSDSDSTTATITDPTTTPPTTGGDSDEDHERNKRDKRDRDSYNRNRNRDERFWRYRRSRD